jgi:acetyl-CoA acetyltransferase
MPASDVFIVSAVRSAIGVGKPNGALFAYQPVELAAALMAEAVRRAGIEPGRVEDALWGVVTPIGDQGGNLARLAALRAGVPGGCGRRFD